MDAPDAQILSIYNPTTGGVIDEVALWILRKGIARYRWPPVLHSVVPGRSDEVDQ